MFIASTENHSGISSCNITHNVVPGFTITDHQEYTVNESDLGNHFYRRWVFLGLTLAAGEYISFYDGTSSGNPIVSVAGPFSGSFDTGCFQVTSSPKLVTQVFHGLPVSDCSDDSDCGPCEKCVDGSCVPCDECSDGQGSLIHYFNNPLLMGDQLSEVPVNWSNAEILDIPIGPADIFAWSYSYRLTCPKGFAGETITLTEQWHLDSDVGILTDPVIRTVTTTKGAKYVDIPTGDWLNRIDMFAMVPYPAFFSGKVNIGRVGPEYGACADDLGPDPGGPPKPPPTEPPPTEPPPEPTGGDEPLEIDEPLPPQPETPLPPEPRPPEPQTGCECEIYQAKMILSGFEQVRNALILQGNKIDARMADSDRVLFGRFTSMEKVLYQQLSETNRLLYQLSNWFGNNFFAEFKQLRESVAQVSDDITDIRDSLRLAPCEPDYPEGKTITQIADDFERHYYPATVEVLENDVVLDTGSDEPDIFCRKLRK